jgi:tetratricopeptide (TPR) repeat protein
LCNYAHLLHTGKKELDKAEVMYTKALQAEPHRAATLFNYAAYLLKRGQVREARDMYARACELEPTNSWIQKHGHLFQDAAQQTRHVQTTPETQSRRNLRATLSKTCAHHGMQGVE